MNRLVPWLVAVIVLQGSIVWIHRNLHAQSPSAVQSPTSAQSPAAKPPRLEFDVASVKRNKLDEKPHSNFSLDSGNIYSTVKEGDVFAPNGGYFSATNQSLWQYIVFAYNLRGTQELALRFSYFAGLSSKVPTWVSGGFDVPAEGFDIEARAEGHPTKDQMRVMMQALLANRFKLAVHMETRQAPVFALVLVKTGITGPHLQPHPVGDSCATPPPTESAAGPAPAAPTLTAVVGELPIVCGVIAHVPSTISGPSHYGGRNVTMDLLASSLPTMTGMAILSRPVIDQTGLNGAYDFTLGGWASQAASEAGEPGPTFTEVLKNQLGLKLERRTGPVDVLVIDHIEHPSEN